jgi:hypothetical protein
MMNLLQRVNRALDKIWLPQDAEAVKHWQLFLLALTGGLALGLLIQNAPILGYDWITMFHRNLATDIYYPPWTSIVLYPLAQLPPRLGLGLINGITIAAVTMMTYNQGRRSERGWRLLATFLSLISFQVALVLWTGHIDGLAMLAIWGLPWAVPLLLMKSTFVGFAVFARKSWFVAAIIFGIVSLFIWPGWPIELMSTLAFRNTHPASAGWEKTGWLPVVSGLFLFLKSKRTDVFQMLAAGAFLYPFFLPYHHIVLLPVLGELRGMRLILAWLLAWAMLLPIGFGVSFYVYFLFPFMIWWVRWLANGNDHTWLALPKDLRASH